MTRALFICSRNRLRSPTAEQIFAGWPGVQSDSAGLAADAEVPLSAEQLHWAELIFVMERVHQRRLQRRFGALLKGKRVICLGIPDDYQYMQPELVELLQRKVGGYLR
ncbi:low molecular weight protein tyrosine phosphatase family protein [Pseudomonas alcaligenes]|jgi:predicted protein tyrosine phosphatase|uniref:low molecular weight protein tyrosine phosphatase family protein n=1 Tax=Aquipseudomonas alcaligenes TaxID=43263 RepID=UPI002E7B0937|nr:low molecular weight protein tyrosine phosphatase family protein [Pseudomonas alcaligenes]MEE1947507.1 low molecular weight protein tyrosine phosphatase family protein [Pseudomonas alcaligenes]